jgi:hypothetical protein
MHPGVTGVVILFEDTPTVLGEYWHTVRTDEGEYDHPGSDLEANRQSTQPKRLRRLEISPRVQ